MRAAWILRRLVKHWFFSASTRGGIGAVPSRTRHRLVAGSALESGATVGTDAKGVSRGARQTSYEPMLPQTSVWLSGAKASQYTGLSCRKEAISRRAAKSQSLRQRSSPPEAR